MVVRQPGFSLSRFFDSCSYTFCGAMCAGRERPGRGSSFIELAHIAVYERTATYVWIGGYMEIKFDFNSLRFRSARYRSYFTGRKIALWRFLLLVGAVSAVISMVLGATALGYILVGASMLILQLYLWWTYYLKQLPTEEGEGSIADILGIADAEILHCIEPDHSPQSLWQNLKKGWSAQFIVNRLGLDPEEVEHILSTEVQASGVVWQKALELTRESSSREVRAGYLVPALIESVEGADQWLATRKLSYEDIREVAYWQVRTSIVAEKLEQKRSFGGVARDWAAGYTPLINRFGRDLSREIEHGAYQHLYLQTHSEQLEGMLKALSQPRNNAVALVGGTGSGKTSLAYALAERLLDPQNKVLQYHKVFSLDASLIVAQAKRTGNLESLLLHIVAEARRAGNIVLFFDDAYSFFSDESGATNMTNVLLQVMRSSSVRMLFAFRPQDWQYLDSVAGDVTAQVNQLVVQEPHQKMVERVLQDQSLAIEAETNATISYQAIIEAYKLSDRYIAEQAFPGKAINLLRSAASIADGGWVTHETVQKAVEGMTGVKVADTTPEESSVLLHLEDELHKYMINQNYAVGAVADALRRARAGVRTHNRPVGSFLFLGPTGVGKTELTKALARVYYGGTDKIIRIDMSEYAQATSVDRLLASSANAGSFLGQLRQSPFSVVLLDEVEKSSLEVQNLLLQALDEGTLTDQDSRSVSLKDAIVITTSNAGADIIRANIEEGKNLEDFSEEFVDQLIDKQQFRPELINRFDEVVLFRPLNKQELREVVALLLQGVNANLATQKIAVQLTDSAVDYIVDEGYDPRLGARPMRRMVQRTVENVVAKRVLQGNLQAGAQTVLDVDDLKAE